MTFSLVFLASTIELTTSECDYGKRAVRLRAWPTSKACVTTLPTEPLNEWQWLGAGYLLYGGDLYTN